ncbi:MAG: hypothetical protein QME96_17775, partial [Myxococcota bacterium]|nr:hypothetical protein [Myxococcota bacterium]
GRHVLRIPVRHRFLRSYHCRRGASPRRNATPSPEHRGVGVSGYGVAILVQALAAGCSREGPPHGAIDSGATPSAASVPSSPRQVAAPADDRQVIVAANNGPEGDAAVERGSWWPVPSHGVIGMPLAGFTRLLPPEARCETKPRREGTIVRCEATVAGRPAEATVRTKEDGRIAEFGLRLVTDPSPITGLGRTLSADEVKAWALAVEAEAVRVLGPPAPADVSAASQGPPDGVNRRSLRWRGAGARTPVFGALDLLISPGLRMASFRLSREELP